MFSDLPVLVRRRRRSNYSKIQFRGGVLYVTVPPGTDPLALLERHREWIEEKATIVRDAEIERERIRLHERSRGELRALVMSLVARYAGELGVRPGRVAIRAMTNKWGSCSFEGNLTFNLALAYVPDELVAFVVFHEVAHLLEPSHNEWFQEIVARRFPDRVELEKRLFASWLALERRGWPARSNNTARDARNN